MFIVDTFLVSGDTRLGLGFCFRWFQRLHHRPEPTLNWPFHVLPLHGFLHAGRQPKETSRRLVEATKSGLCHRG